MLCVYDFKKPRKNIPKYDAQTNKIINKNVSLDNHDKHAPTRILTLNNNFFFFFRRSVNQYIEPKPKFIIT